MELTGETGGIKAVGHFDAEVPLFFGGLLGMSTASVSKECQTQIAETMKIQFHFLIDTSMSMGLAATVADRAKMEEGTQQIPG